jgi:hypothetical protein
MRGVTLSIALLTATLFVTGCASPFVGTWQWQPAERSSAFGRTMPDVTSRLIINPDHTFLRELVGEDRPKPVRHTGEWHEAGPDWLRLTMWIKGEKHNARATLLGSDTLKVISPSPGGGDEDVSRFHRVQEPDRSAVASRDSE